MRLGFDAKRLFNNFTGLGNYSRTLLSDLQHYFPEEEYHLFTPKVQDNPRSAPFLKSPYQMHRPAGGNAAYWRTLGIKKDLQQQQIDVFHGLSHEIPVGIQHTKVKAIVTMHDLVFFHFPKLFPWLDRQIYQRKFRYACKNAHRIVAISKNTKQDIMDFYQIPAEKIEVIYQTCDPIFKTPIPQKNKLDNYGLPQDYLLYVGSIIERKNLLPIVQALARFPADQRMPLVVLGQGKAYKEKVLQFIKKQGMEQQVFFPKVAFTDFPAIYHQAKLLLYPSSYEGFGIPIIEALFCQTPVITTLSSSLPEAAGPGAHYVQRPLPEDIHNAIETVLGDVEYAQQLATAGHQYVQQFRSEPLARQMMSCYQKTLED